MKDSYQSRPFFICDVSEHAADRQAYSLFPVPLVPRSLSLCFSHLTISGEGGHTPELCPAWCGFA